MKWYGSIGFAVTEKTGPGVWEPSITERKYKGDTISCRRITQQTDQVNDNINIANQISIVADPFANQNFYAMKYVEFMGAKWKITNVEVQPPRLVLTVGGLYNDNE